jgi:hypothetical protein
MNLADKTLVEYTEKDIDNLVLIIFHCLKLHESMRSFLKLLITADCELFKRGKGRFSKHWTLQELVNYYLNIGPGAQQVILEDGKLDTKEASNILKTFLEANDEEKDFLYNDM